MARYFCDYAMWNCSLNGYLAVDIWIPQCHYVKRAHKCITDLNDVGTNFKTVNKFQ